MPAWAVKKTLQLLDGLGVEDTEGRREQLVFKNDHVAAVLADRRRNDQAFKPVVTGRAGQLLRDSVVHRIQKETGSHAELLQERHCPSGPRRN